MLEKPTPTRQEQVDATWLAEAVQVLGWGLGLVDLDHFARCDDNLASHFPRPDDETGARELVQAATLRPFEDVYRECDLIYCLHWAALDARLKGLDSPLDEGVMRQRHKAINWLIGVEDDWDAVPTDT